MDNVLEEYTPKAKRVRAPNFTNAEKEIFTDLLEKYSTFIECKKTDAVSNLKKTKKWVEMCNDFNSRSDLYYRTVANLQSLWENMKRDARKSAAHQRAENIKTAATRYASDDPTVINLKVLNIMERSAKGIETAFEGDNMSDMIEGTSLSMKPSNGESIFEISQEVNKWNTAVPKMLYDKKPDVLTVNRTESNLSTTPEEKSVPYIEPASTGLQQSYKRNIEDEQEWDSECKKRKPSLEDDINEQLTIANINLTIAKQIKLERESEREDILFEIDKRKKELEVQIMEIEKREKEINVEMMEIQLLKMRKEMQENN